MKDESVGWRVFAPGTGVNRAIYSPGVWSSRAMAISAFLFDRGDGDGFATELSAEHRKAWRRWSRRGYRCVAKPGLLPRRLGWFQTKPRPPRFGAYWEGEWFVPVCNARALMSVEPTPEMIDAAMAKVDPLDRDNYITREDAAEIYRAMVEVEAEVIRSAHDSLGVPDNAQAFLIGA